MATKQFSIILLVVLVASQCTATDDTSDTVPEIIKKAIDLVKGEVEKVESMAKNVEHEVQEEFGKVTSQVKEELEKVVQQLKDEMKTVSQTSAKVIPCITAEHDNISSIFTNAEKQGQMCVLKAGMKIFPLLTKVNATIQKVKQNVNDFIADMKKAECTSSFRARMKCFVNEMPKVKQAVQERVTEVQAEIQQAKDTIPQVVQVVQQCVQKIIQDSTNELKAIFNEVKTCIMG